MVNHTVIQQTAINQNFYHSMNYAYRPSAWGRSPWWHRDHHRASGHCDRWSYHWSAAARPRHYHWHRPYGYRLPGYSSYSRRTHVPWGLVSWTLGSLIYDTGYGHYTNPYAHMAPPAVGPARSISYDRPLAVQSAALVVEEVPPMAEELSAAAFQRARDSFLAGDYPAALKSTDEAIAHTPDDPMLHEFRALSLFALGSYAEAAGVMHAILASGPGWSEETLLGFYASPETYLDQLARLEQYAAASDSGGAHFLLGYHQVVGGRLEQAAVAFARAAEIETEDSLAAELQRLVEHSLVEEVETAVSSAPAIEAAPPIPAERLAGVWQAVSAGGQPIMLALAPESRFTWTYGGAEGGQVLEGTWAVDADGLLVLADEDAQMVASIDLESETALRFILVGGPEGDQGLLFERR